MTAIDINTIQKSVAGQIATGARPQQNLSRRGGVLTLVLGIVVAVAVGGTAGAISFFDARLKKDIASVNVEIEALENRRDRSIEVRLIGFDTQLKTLKKLLDQHTHPVGVFDVLEETTLPETVLRSFTWSTEGRLAIAGETASYGTLGKQLVVYSDDRRLANVQLTNFSQGQTGSFDFSISASLKPEATLSTPASVSP
ncbi:hypothetical protein HYW67_01685 [Candidatus Parcubacteria bacterium]|nr:hypothetical protein [Candidatus Parcubacteria bacterium]